LELELGVVEAPSDRAGGGVQLPSPQEQQRPTRLRVLAHLIRLTEGLLR
jgi:hypothetical protein